MAQDDDDEGGGEVIIIIGGRSVPLRDATEQERQNLRRALDRLDESQQ